jgi:ribosomal protein S12 methylthiotransferase accessory factor
MKEGQREFPNELILTGDDRNALSESQSGDVLRFVPNLSVYVLPRDTVCLYSEHRKFFLHGKLYCALVPRLGAGEPRASIVRALSREFPAAEIERAFERLLDRGFIFYPGTVDGPVAGYWASLGLAPEAAAVNLHKIGVRVESCGLAGANELIAALREFGVRVVDRSADLIIVLANDYLDERLAEMNRQWLAEKQDWLPVQLSGIFPLVGPIFRPGKGACWTCLADRMKSNRQVKAFLDRQQARCVAASPLAETMLGDSAIGLAAVEIARAIASGFGTDLQDHLISLDLLRSTVVRHCVAARPQCPSCGREELRDAQRTPAPIRLRAGGKLVMTGGGYRAVAPAVTVARFRKLVSPLTGVVSHLERIPTDLPLNAGYVAKHNFSPRPETVDALKGALSRDSYGKGSTAEQAEAGALMEAIERDCGIFQGNEIRTIRRFTDFPAGDAILPNDILLLSDKTALGQLDPSAEIEWSPVWSLRDERFKYAPTGLLYFFYAGEGDDQVSADSNGCAAGNTLEEAIVHGFLELVERDAYAIWWYNRLQRPEIDIATLGDTYILDLRAQLAAAGRRLWVLDITSDLGIPAVVAVSSWTEDARERVALGAGAHFDRRIAALRAVTELNLRMAIDAMSGSRTGPAAGDGGDPVPLRRHAYVLPHGKAALGRPSSLPNFARLDRREQVLACVKTAKRRGLDFLVLDQTRPDVEIPVAKVIVPGLRHVDRRFAPGRLYDVPVKLGLRRRPLREAELNPLHPRA